jgi:ethanolamine permease
MESSNAGVSYAKADDSYFKARGLQRYAGIWSLWALGVGAVISGHFSGWNFGFGTGGWGGMLVAGVIIAIMYFGLVFSIAEMSPALPHTGAAYSFARSAMGPWGGFITGLCENVEYIMTPTVVCYFISTYLNGIFEAAGVGAVPLPILWIATFIIFLWLNIKGVELSFKVTLVVTLLSLGILVVFWFSAIPHIDFNKYALNIAPDGSELPEGGGPWFPFGFEGVLKTLPFAVWLFLAIEQLPLAAEESVDPKRDMPKGIILGMATLVVSAFMIVWLNPSIEGIGTFKLATSAETLLDGFRQIYGSSAVVLLGIVALTGLIASFHTILYAMGRQVYSLSRAGYFPTALSVTGKGKTPYVAMFGGSLVGLVIMTIVYFVAEDQIGTTLLNMAVFGAMCSYILQAVSFILLRVKLPDIARPYKSPFGIPGAVVTIVIAAVTLFYQLGDASYQKAIYGVIAWFAAGIVYFAAVGRHKLILSPEEEFAMSKGTVEYKTH